MLVGSDAKTCSRMASRRGNQPEAAAAGRAFAPLATPLVSRDPSETATSPPPQFTAAPPSLLL